MSTPAQIAANQQNAQHSTGPRTIAGKAAMAHHNLRHGFTGAFSILAWELQEHFDAMLAEFTQEHQPTTFTETILVQRMAQSHWLTMRALLLQNTCFNQESPLETVDKQLALYIRYQTTHERAFHKCLNELLKLRAEKRKAEIGSDSQKRKEGNEARKEAAAIQRQNNENRKQERHPWDILLTQAKVDNQILQNMNLPGSSDRVGASIQRIIALEKAA